MRKLLGLIFVFILVVLSCARTTPEETRTNPLDRAFDDNGFRMVLNFPTNDGGNYTITWSKLFATGNDREESDFTFISGNLLSRSGDPSTSEINEIKTQAQITTNFASVTNISGVLAGGSFNLGAIGSKTSFVLEFNYTSTENGAQTTKYLHSNIITFTP